MKRQIFLTFFMLLASCSPMQQDYAPKRADEQVSLEENSFIAADGAALPLRIWQPIKKPKAVILALHGFNDYSNSFMRAGTYFAKQNMVFYAYDQRGFGENAARGIWAGTENLTRDAISALDALKKRYPKLPVYLLGESMGGAVAVNAAADPDFPAIDGIILVSPALWGGETMSGVYASVLWLVAHSFPDAMFSGKELKIMATNNIPVLRRMVKDPNIIKQTRADAIYGVVDLMDRAYANLARVDTPVLLLYGAYDQVIPLTVIEHSLEHFSEPVVIGYYPDGYHMLLRDMQGEQVLGDIASWIKHPKNHLPSGYGLLFVPKPQLTSP